MGKILSDPRCVPFLAAIADRENNREYVHGVFGDFLLDLGEEEEAWAQRLAAQGGPELVWCPPGQFKMGYRHLKTALTRGFWMGKYPVIQEEYRQVMGENPSYFSARVGGAGRVNGMNTARFPVETVSWVEAMEFCGKLTKAEQKAGRLPKDREYRLPTEAQWEYACRAGTTTKTPYGNQISGKLHANFCDIDPEAPELRRPTEVGSYMANPWGLHDMLGNVWEFCLDEFQVPLPGGVDPYVPYRKRSGHRVCRGGSWMDFSDDCKSSSRRPNSRLDRIFNQGFRLVAISS